LWATQRMFPLVKGGEMARGLEACRRAGLGLHARLTEDDRFRVAFAPELDIVIWAPRRPTASETSQRSRAIFEAAASRGLHLAVASLPKDLLAPWWGDLEWDRDQVAVLRSCLIKPEHSV